MTAPLKPDLCVVGTTPGARAVAGAAAARGHSTVRVDRGEPELDMPMLALLALGRKLRRGRELAVRGVLRADELAVDPRAVGAILQEAQAAFAPNRLPQRLVACGVRVLPGPARFRDKRTLLVADQPVLARRYLVTCGRRPVVPEIVGLERVEALSVADVLQAYRRFGHLVVFGGGGEAVAVAQACRRLGSAVTLVCEGSALAAEDPEMAAVVLRRLEAEGVVLRQGATQLWTERKDRSGVRLGFIDAGGDASVQGTHLLVAAGDEPDLDGLALRAAGIPLADGRILVDAALRSTNRRVHAIGGAAGAPAEAEGDQARLFLDRLLNRNPAPRAVATAPRQIRSDPQLARVGLTEAEARRKGLAFRVLRASFAEDVRARAEGSGEGHLKVLVGRNGRILGAAAAGSDAAEAIAPFALAMARGEGLRAVADAPISPFSAGQFGKRAALAYFNDDAGARPAGGFSRLLRLFG